MSMKQQENDYIPNVEIDSLEKAACPHLIGLWEIVLELVNNSLTNPE